MLKNALKTKIELKMLKLKCKTFHGHDKEPLVQELKAFINKNPSLSFEGIFNLPTKTKNYTVNRSTHVNNKSKDTLTLKTHTFVIILKAPWITQDTTESEKLKNNFKDFLNTKSGFSFSYKEIKKEILFIK